MIHWVTAMRRRLWKPFFWIKLSSILRNSASPAAAIRNCLSFEFNNFNLMHGWIFGVNYFMSQPWNIKSSWLQPPLHWVIVSVYLIVRWLTLCVYHSFIFNSLYPTQMAPMTTTVGKLEPPFGKTRLQVLKMFSAILQTNSDDVNEEFAKLGTLQAMWVSMMGVDIQLCQQAFN